VSLSVTMSGRYHRQFADDRKASPVKNQENFDRNLWPEGSDRS
jgi:hypothetical protein